MFMCCFCLLSNCGSIDYFVDEQSVASSDGTDSASIQRSHHELISSLRHARLRQQTVAAVVQDDSGQCQ